jgi:hypothetical protein
MNVQVQPHVTATRRHLPFECVALALQGGGALGAYQAGQTLEEVERYTKAARRAALANSVMAKLK